MSFRGLLESVLDFGPGGTFYGFSNSDGKSWLMPRHNMRTAMRLYQPSSWRGKLVRGLFPVLHRSVLVRAVVRAEVERVDLKPEFRALLENLFGVKGVEFSIFSGTPSVHQKITMQVSRGERILGYCKVTDSEEVGGLFEREAGILDGLASAGLDRVPRSLYHGLWQGGVYLFVQTTAKSVKSEILHSWGDLQEGFLAGMSAATEVEIPFERSDYYMTVKALEEHIDWLPDERSREVVRAAISCLHDEFDGREVVFSAYHADFTPWNMFVEQGRLFVFDWEYARMTYPPMLDRYHFFTQTAVFERHWGAERILEQVRRNSWWEFEPGEYRLYLLDVISRFTLREKGRFSGDVAEALRVWVDLVGKLNDII